MKQINRRRFLSAAEAGLGSAAAGAAVPHKIRTGILCIQHSHLHQKLDAMYRNSTYDVVSVCEPDEATRRESGSHPLVQRLRCREIDPQHIIHRNPGCGYLRTTAK
jgi:hypothetical protein